MLKIGWQEFLYSKMYPETNLAPVAYFELHENYVGFFPNNTIAMTYWFQHD